MPRRSARVQAQAKAAQETAEGAKKEQQLQQQQHKGSDGDDEVKETNSPKKAKTTAPKKGKKAAVRRKDTVKEKEEDTTQEQKKTTSLKKAASAGVPRDSITRPTSLSKEKGPLKILSWNVNGLRAVVRNSLNHLEDLVEKEKPDILCIQETKLQPVHVKDHVHLLPGYTGYWSCSVAKKGYAGTAIFVRGKQPEPESLPHGAFHHYEKGDRDDKDHPPTKVNHVTFGLGTSKHDQEGRTITLELDKFYLIALYVPNSGVKLERLEYRTKEWNKDLLAYLKQLEKKKPVLVTGDLNVAHLDEDIYNYYAKHIHKVAGCTPQERQAFTDFLGEGYVDTFRHLHGNVRGAFTYWSARTRGREHDKGLRLDYFVCSKQMTESIPKVNDSFHLDKVLGSDHCPVGCVVQTAK